MREPRKATMHITAKEGSNQREKQRYNELQEPRDSNNSQQATEQGISGPKNKTFHASTRLTSKASGRRGSGAPIPGTIIPKKSQWVNQLKRKCGRLVHMWYVATYVNYAFSVRR
jgi:hypothetical protein